MHSSKAIQLYPIHTISGDTVLLLTLVSDIFAGAFAKKHQLNPKMA